MSFLVELHQLGTYFFDLLCNWKDSNVLQKRVRTLGNVAGYHVIAPTLNIRICLMLFFNGIDISMHPLVYSKDVIHIDLILTWSKILGSPL